MKQSETVRLVVEAYRQGQRGALELSNHRRTQDVRLNDELRALNAGLEGHNQACEKENALLRQQIEEYFVAGKDTDMLLEGRISDLVETLEQSRATINALSAEVERLGTTNEKLREQLTDSRQTRIALGINDHENMLNRVLRGQQAAHEDIKRLEAEVERLTSDNVRLQAELGEANMTVETEREIELLAKLNAACAKETTPEIRRDARLGRLVRALPNELGIRVTQHGRWQCGAFHAGWPEDALLAAGITDPRQSPTLPPETATGTPTEATVASDEWAGVSDMARQAIADAQESRKATMAAKVLAEAAEPRATDLGTHGSGNCSRVDPRWQA